MGLLSRAAWLSAVAYFAINDTELLMEKDFASLITITKWIWLHVLHPLSGGLETPEAFGELLLQHTVLAESRCVWREPDPCPGMLQTMMLLVPGMSLM